MINEIIQGDIREIAKQLETGSVNCIVTSPPYWGLRDYGTAKWVGGDPACDHKPGNVSRVGASTLTGGKNHSGHLHEGYKGDCLKCGAKRVDRQIGLEPTPEEYVAGMVAIFRELRRVLRDDGVLWLNLGDTYWGGKGQSGQGNPEKQAARVAAGISLNNVAAHVAGQGKTRPQDGSHETIKPKDLIGIPWRVALALQADGWYLRSDIIWSKPNCMPESVTDRPTKAHEYIFLLAKSERYYYDAEVIKEPAQIWNGQAAVFERTGPVSEHVLPGQSAAQHRPNRNGKNSFRGQGSNRSGVNGPALRDGRDMSEVGTSQTRNKRSVWEISLKPYSEAHFATFPPDLVQPCILAGCPPGGVVLDPFFGSGTTGQVCVETGRNWLGVELNPKYIKLAKKRIAGAQPPLIVVGNTPPSNNPLQPNGYRCEQQPLFAVGESGNSGASSPPAIG